MTQLWPTFFNLVPPYFDIVVSIRARLLVVKAQRMEELVLHNGLGVTPGADWHILACSVIPNIRPASAENAGTEITTWPRVFCYCSLTGILSQDVHIIKLIGDFTAWSHRVAQHFRDSPGQLGEGDVAALSFIGLEVHTGSQTIFLKSLEDHTFSIQLWNEGNPMSARVHQLLVRWYAGGHVLIWRPT